MRGKTFFCRICGAELTKPELKNRLKGRGRVCTSCVLKHREY
jgi:hypothetical protein